MANKPNHDGDVTPPPPKTPAAIMDSISSQLETSKAERHVWLMKCPPVVARAMQQQRDNQQPPTSFPSEGQTVGKVIVSIDPLLPNDDFSSTQFTMELAGSGNGIVPQRYTMDMSTDFIPMSVFAESSQGKPSAEGKIYHKFDMKPHNGNSVDYAKLCRERMNKYNTRTRQTQIINDDVGMRMRPMAGMLEFKSSTSADKKKVPAKGSEKRRTRRDPDEMEKIMFKLFERQPNWTLKQLILQTDQPEQFLKDMLKLLCVYNNKGAKQGSYELKPEYRKLEDKSKSQ